MSFRDTTPTLCSVDSREIPSKLIHESSLVGSISRIKYSDVPAVPKQNRVAKQTSREMNSTTRKATENHTSNTKWIGRALQHVKNDSLSRNISDTSRSGVSN